MNRPARSTTTSTCVEVLHGAAMHTNPQSEFPLEEGDARSEPCGHVLLAGPTPYRLQTQLP